MWLLLLISIMFFFGTGWRNSPQDWKNDYVSTRNGCILVYSWGNCSHKQSNHVYSFNYEAATQNSPAMSRPKSNKPGISQNTRPARVIILGWVSYTYPRSNIPGKSAELQMLMKVPERRGAMVYVYACSYTFGTKKNKDTTCAPVNCVRHSAFPTAQLLDVWSVIVRRLRPKLWYLQSAYHLGSLHWMTPSVFASQVSNVDPEGVLTIDVLRNTRI